MKIKLSSLIKKYGGMWVALDEELSNVVSSGKVAEKVFDDARKKGLEVPYLFKVPQKLTAYIG